MRTAFVGTRAGVVLALDSGMRTVRRRLVRYREIAEHLNCPEKLVARAFSRRTMFSFIRPKADILRKDLAEAKGTNAWANLRNVKLAKLEEGLREAIDAFDGRSRDVMPTKVKAPRLPVWMRQVARDVWEFDKNRRDVYIGLMELLCPKERFDLVRKRAKRLWKETINSSKTSN
jgi:hypothetical protein